MSAVQVFDLSLCVSAGRGQADITPSTAGGWGGGC